ncbi:MAG: DUF11 domain-containing protein, partial [Candidatus Omnitrophica bacterium]|nr:DUF11 domain-containing protein [Candidatus Omnitrophota bacterium]
MRPHHSTTVCLAMGLWLLLAPPAFARTATWDGGGGDANASTAANWDTDTAPTNGDDVIFDGTSTKDCTWDIAPVLGLNTFSMNAGYTGTVTTDGIGRTLFSSGTTISSGTLTVSVNDTLDIATNNDPLTVNSGGTVTINGIFDASAGTATLTVNGSMTLSGLTNGNVVRPITIGSTGTLTLSMSAASTLSGTVTVNGALTATTDATLSGTVTVNSGGTLTVNSGGTPTVSGTLTANSGGTLAVNGTLTNSGTTFTLNAGATLNGTGTLSRTNATAPTLSGTIAMQSGSTFGTFRYAIGASATIPATTYTSHLALQGTGGANRTFTIGAGTLLTVAGNVTMDHSGGAALRLTIRDTINNTPITIGGNWDDDGSSGTATYTRGTEKVTFDGSGATGTITLDTTNITTSWNHVTFNESGTTFNVTGTSTVRGALTVGSGTTLDIDGDMTMTTAGSSIDNSGVIDETGGQILHPATSLKLTDANGIEVSGYAIKDQPVYVTLIDEDENVNGTRPDEANGVTVSIAGGDSETLSGPLILRETGDKTETFRNTTGLPTALLQAGQSGTANNGVLELLATDTISVAYTDAEDSTDSSAADTAATQTVGSSLMTIGQSVSSTRVSPGQPVVVTATLTNNQTTNSLTFRVEDTLPAGFVFQAGSATLDQVATTPTGAGQPLAFSNLTVSAGATRTLRYLLITGSAAPGQYVNTVVARINPIISNTSQVTLTVVPDPLFTLATVLGKVFVDANANGRQDRHEP